MCQLINETEWALLLTLDTFVIARCHLSFCQTSEEVKGFVERVVLLARFSWTGTHYTPRALAGQEIHMNARSSFSSMSMTPCPPSKLPSSVNCYLQASPKSLQYSGPLLFSPSSTTPHLMTLRTMTHEDHNRTRIQRPIIQYRDTSQSAGRCRVSRKVPEVLVDMIHDSAAAICTTERSCSYVVMHACMPTCFHTSIALARTVIFSRVCLLWAQT